MTGSPSRPGLEELVDYVSSRSGLAFAGPRREMLCQALLEAAELQNAEPVELLRRVMADGDAFAALCHRVTVQESYFFREPAKVEALRECLRAEATSRPHLLRIWSAGCATGEEVYTLAMKLDDAGLRGRYHLLGTDLSPTAVATAEAATFGRWSLRGLDETTVARYFLREGRRYRVRPEFRTAVEFRQHNVLDPLPGRLGPFDAILCRNLLIYLTDEAVARAAGRLACALVPGGWLVTGASDPPLDDVESLETVATGHGLAYRRLDPRRTASAAQPPSAPSLPTEVHRQTPRATPPPAPPPASPRSTPDLTTLITDGERALHKARSGAAAALARMALAIDPASAAAHRILVLALAQQRLMREAVAAVGAAVAALPTDAEMHRLRAAVLLDAGQPAEASTAAQRAVDLDADLVPAHLLLGRAEELLGHPVGARRAQRRARRLIAAGQRPS
jgi:chemotaxis protein methyltransferase CheR